MTTIGSSVLQAIGHTPLVRLTRVVSPGSADVLVKLELANPTGSYKDRMALAMIEGAEARGALRSGMRVVEFTGGSTGSSLGMVCAAKGYRYWCCRRMPSPRRSCGRWRRSARSCGSSRATAAR